MTDQIASDAIRAELAGGSPFELLSNFDKTYANLEVDHDLERKEVAAIIAGWAADEVDAADYVVISDGQASFAVESADLREGDTEAGLRRISPDGYADFCQQVGMDDRCGGVGTIGCRAFCDALAEAGATEWDVGGPE